MYGKCRPVGRICPPGRGLGALVLAVGLLIGACGQETSPPAGSDGQEVPDAGEPDASADPTADPTDTPRVIEPTPPDGENDGGGDDGHTGEFLPIERAEPDPADPSILHIHYWLATPCEPGLREAEVSEDDTAVRVSLHQLPESAGDEDTACIQVIVEEKTEVQLEAPLGDREVVNGATGQPVPTTG